MNLNLDFFEPRSEELILKYDSKGKVLFLGVCTDVMIYSQYLFFSPSSRAYIVVKLINLINEGDQPPCDSKGKTSLRIVDAVWSSNDEYVVILFKSRCLAIASRLGSLIAFLNPTFQNFQKSNPDMRPEEVGLSETEPKMFNPLFFQEQIGTSSFLGSDFLSLKRGAEDDYVVLIDRHYLRLKLFIQDKKIVKNAYLALRLMLSLQEKKFDSELLASLPFLFDGILPQKNDFIFQTRNVGVKNAAQMMRKSTNEINREKIELKSSIVNQKVKSKELVINFSNALFCLLWDKNAPLNYRSWIFELFQESFNYLLFKDESQSAFHLVKIFEGVLIPLKPEQEKRQAKHSDIAPGENLYQGQANLVKQRVELLVYYLIQFRNHQSNNFNILNLSLSVFLHRQFKHLRRFSLYIKRIIRCITENIKTHESEIDKEIFLGTQIQNSISEFPSVFPGLFDEPAPPKLKTLEKCYKWFFTDDLIEFVGLIGFYEIIGEKAALRMRMEHTPEPLIKIIAFLLSSSEAYVESEVGHYIQNKDSYVSFVSQDSDGYSQKRREANERKIETPGDTGTSNFESDFIESSSLGVSEERKKSRKEGAAQKFQQQMLALKENSVQFYYCNLANILVTIAFQKLKTFLHHPLPLTSIFDGLWHSLHGKTPHIVDLVLTALQEGDRPSEANVNEEVLLWEATVLLTTVDELEALFVLRHKIQQHLSPQHFFRFTEMLILLLSKKLLCQPSQRQVETANWIKQLYYSVVKKDMIQASINQLMSKGSIKVSLLRNVTHLVSEDSQFFLADGSLHFLVECAQKATYYLNLTNLRLPSKPQKLSENFHFRFSGPFFELIPCKDNLLDFLMSRSSNPEQRVKVVSSLTLVSSLEYAFQCLFNRDADPFVQIDPNSSKIAHFFEKVKKHTHGDFQANLFLSKHFFHFLNPNVQVGDYHLTLASYTNSLCNLILLLYIFKLLAELHTAKTKMEKFKLAMRLSFFSPFPLHKSDDIDMHILSHLKARKDTIPEQQLELFACYSNLEKYMSSKYAELWAKVYLKYYKNNKNYLKSESQAKKLRLFLNGNTIKSTHSSKFIFLLKDPKFTHFLENVSKVLANRSLFEPRVQEEKDSLFLLQQRLNTVCCDLQEGYKIPFHSQLRCNPNELKWHVKENNFSLQDFLNPDIQKSNRAKQELKEMISSEGTKVEAVKLSRQICGKETPVAAQEKKFDFSKLKIQELISQSKPEKKIEGMDIAVDALTSEGSEILSQSARKARYKMKKIMKVKRGKDVVEGGLPFQPPPRHLPQANKLTALQKIVNNVSTFQIREGFIKWKEWPNKSAPDPKFKRTHRKIQSHSNFKQKVGQQAEAFSLMVVRDSSRSKRTSSNTPRGRGGTGTASVPKRHMAGGDRSKFKDKRMPSRGRIQTLPDTEALLQSGPISIQSNFLQDRKGNVKLANLLTEASHSYRGAKGHQRRQTPLIGGNFLKVGHHKGSSMNLGAVSPYHASERKQRKSSREVAVPLDSPSSDLLKTVKLKKVTNVQKFMEKFESIKQRIQKVQAEAQQLSIDLRVTGPSLPKEEAPQ